MLATALIAFTLPAAAVVIYASLRPLWAGMPPTDAVGPEHAYRTLAIRTVLFIAALQALIVVNLSGVEWVRPWAPRAVVVLFGLFIAAIGDGLPRTRPNQLFGIRTARTLDDRQLWMRQHRVAGYMAVTAGTAIAMSAFLFSGNVIAWVVSTSALTGAAAVAAVYVAHLPRAEVTSEGRSRRRQQIALWTLRLLLALAFFYFGLTKFPGGPRRMWVRLFDTIGLGQSFRIFTGFVEAGGALLLLTPRGVMPGVMLLGAAMIGALLVHVFILGIGFATVAVVILLAMLLGLALASRTW